jgi:hypothetical protein
MGELCLLLGQLLDLIGLEAESVLHLCDTPFQSALPLLRQVRKQRLVTQHNQIEKGEIERKREKTSTVAALRAASLAWRARRASSSSASSSRQRASSSSASFCACRVVKNHAQKKHEIFSFFRQREREMD